MFSKASWEAPGAESLASLMYEAAVDQPCPTSTLYGVSIDKGAIKVCPNILMRRNTKMGPSIFPSSHTKPGEDPEASQQRPFGNPSAVRPQSHGTDFYFGPFWSPQLWDRSSGPKEILDLWKVRTQLSRRKLTAPGSPEKSFYLAVSTSWGSFKGVIKLLQI